MKKARSRAGTSLLMLIKIICGIASVTNLNQFCQSQGLGFLSGILKATSCWLAGVIVVTGFSLTA
jgi:hypothetical protein